MQSLRMDDGQHITNPDMQQMQKENQIRIIKKITVNGSLYIEKITVLGSLYIERENGERFFI